MRLLLHQQQLESMRQQHQVLINKHQNSVDSAATRGNKELEEVKMSLGNLLKELEQIRATLTVHIDDGQTVPLSPIKAAAQERIVRQNTELAEFVNKLNEEKKELRNALANLEEQIAQYRQRERANQQNSRQTKEHVESVLNAEREKWAQEKARSQQALRSAEAELARLREEASKDAVPPIPVSGHESDTEEITWPRAKILKLYKRFIKAESFRKALVYQKRYLLLLLGGFQDCESTTLAMISQMGAFPANPDRSFRRTAVSRFRTAARAVLAIQRMNFLVKKSKRVSISGSRDNTSRSRVLNGDVNGHEHTVYQATANTYTPRSTQDRPSNVSGTNVVPTLNLHEPSAGPMYTDRYSPRSDRRTYEKYHTAINGDTDFRSRSVRPATASSSERFSRREDKPIVDDPLSQRSHVPSSSRSPRTFSPTSWSDTRTTSVPLAREPTGTDYPPTLKSPPVRDTGTTRREYGDRDRFDPTPRHSSPYRRERSISPDGYRHSGRPLSPSGTSSVGSAHNGSESGDHSLNLYIHRLESLQNRLGAFNRGGTASSFPKSRRY